MTRKPRSGPRRALTPSATTLRASMSKPESVSSITAKRVAEQPSGTLRCASSPPEKPSLTERLSMDSSIFTSSMRSCTRSQKSIASTDGSPRYLRTALTAAFRKYRLATPGISTGYWKARNRPSQARDLRGHLQQILAIEQDLALGDFIAFAAGDHVGQGVLPEPFGPMMAWVSPGE